MVYNIGDAFDVLCDSATDRDAWLEQREGGAPASETSTILGLNRYQSAYELWAVRHGSLPRANLDDRESVFWGHALESAIMEGYQKRTGRAVVPFGMLCRSKRWPWLLGTPDAFVSEKSTRTQGKYLRQKIGLLRGFLDTDRYPKALADLQSMLIEGEWWPLQIKNVGLRMAEHWAEGCPAEYQVQCAHEALVLGAPRATLAGLIGGQQLVWDDLAIDPEAPQEREIITATEAFLNSLDSGERPAPDGSESSTRAIKSLWPRTEPGTVIELGTDLMFAAAQCDRLGEQIRDLEKQKRTIENLILDAIKDRERAVFADGTGYSLKTITINESVRAASVYRRLSRTGKPRKKKEASQ